MLDLFAYIERPPAHVAVRPWRPRTLKREEWAKRDYRRVYAWRMQELEKLRTDKEYFQHAWDYYKQPAHWHEFVMDWMDTYDPRKKGDDPKWMPFVLFERQEDLFMFLNGCVGDEQNGLIEKCRDMGATWCACAYSVCMWLFTDGAAVGWGSRKEQLVDKIGDPDSIFEKLRALIGRLPAIFRPKGFNRKDHLTYMKCINPANGSTITGEAGDNIGRGGRKTIYFKDESAHYEHPDLIDAALGDNTHVQIDISSVNGLGNLFHRTAEAAVEWYRGRIFERSKTRKFIMDWRDHPEKDQQWYDERRRRDEERGMLHIFAQEVERNYAAALSNAIIDFEWILAAVDADKKLAGWLDDQGHQVDFESGAEIAGFDVADEGIDRNALAIRRGVKLLIAKEWGSRDPGVSARMVITELRERGRIECMYDAIGIGSNVKSEYNRLTQKIDGEPPILEAKQVAMIPWNAGASVLNPFFRVVDGDPKSALNKDFFGNLKAQAWWALRLRFYRTWRAVQMHLKGEKITYDVGDLIVLSGLIPLIRQVEKELAQPTRATTGNLKMIVDKKPDGMKSPNLADAIVMAYFPIPSDFAIATVGGAQ